MSARCLCCRTRRATFTSLVAHVKATGHKACTCGGYHYPHRPFSRYCDQNPMADAWRASRDGATEEQLADITLEIALTRPGRPLKVWP